MVAPLWGPAYPTGSGIYAYELAKRLAKSGHHVDIFTSMVGNFNGERYPENINLHRLRTYGKMWDMNPIANIFPKLISGRFDVIHVHSYIFFMSNLTAMARLFNRFGYVLNIHGGLDHRYVLTKRDPRITVKDMIYDPTLGMFTMRMADRVVSICKKDIEVLRTRFKVDPIHIPNAVDTDAFSYTENDSRTVTYVGKLEHWKGIQDLMEVFKIVKRENDDVKFLVAGEGSLSPFVKMQDLPINIIGHVPHERMPEVYHASAISVLPSLMEGSPTTCIESLSCGVPCVATDVGDTSDIVRHGESGFVVKPRKVKEIAEHINKLLSDGCLRKRMGENGRNDVVERFSYESVSKQMVEVYRSII